ncbi:MAG: hypothetical protein ACRD3N_07615 [Terracidiphilus sp.]
MKPYNGFPPEQRERAQRWLRAEWASGRLVRPSKCCACGQDRGVIDAHAEDYSEPFAGGKTDKFHLCFICHMMVHCRFRNRAAWDRYRKQIAQGGHFAAAFVREFGRFKEEHLDGPAGYDRAIARFVAGPAPRHLVLDEIDAGCCSRGVSGCDS